MTTQILSIEKLQEENNDYRKENSYLKEQIKYLTEQLEWFKRQIFGQRAEKFIDRGLGSGLTF